LEACDTSWVFFKVNSSKHSKFKQGAVNLEFVFMFSLLLIIFVIIFAFEIITIHRIAAVYSIWRIQRVEGISSKEVFVKDQAENGFLHETYFGNLVIDTLKDSNIEIEIPESQKTGIYTVDYNIFLIKGLLNFYYGQNAPEHASDNIDWFEPKPPPDVPEH